MFQSIIQRCLDPGLISRHEVLRSRECETVRDQVFALEKHWKSRSDVGGFFTLGAASYLDAVGSRDVYLEEARKTGPSLWASFDWLYERVRKGFAGLFGQPVSYTEDCALPGFHIFEYQGVDQTNDKPSSRAHFDMQWMHAMPVSRPEETLSFTLPIEEPSGGSSMEVWPVRCDAVRPDFNALKYAAIYPSQTIRYSRGEMVVHDGLRLHAIGLASIAAPRGYRITLQGHGVRGSEGWKLYW